MTYKLFLDDERFPAGTGDKWVEMPITQGSEFTALVEEQVPGDNWFVVRTVEAAVALVDSCGCPEFVAFDHDLGTEATGMTFARWLVEQDMNSNAKFFPANFKYDVHSQNVAGASNIRSYLASYLKQR